MVIGVLVLHRQPDIWENPKVRYHLATQLYTQCAGIQSSTVSTREK